MADLAVAERKKYEKAWAFDSYGAYSPGEQMARVFRQLCRKPGTLVDIGAGSGKGGAALADRWDVTLLDFVEAHDTELEFVRANVFGRWPDRRWDYGFCCDVMEHIPPERVDRTLANIHAHCARVFYSICLREDHFGRVVGEELHLTVQPFTWWRDKLKHHGELLDARDCIDTAIFWVQSNQ